MLTSASAELQIMFTSHCLLALRSVLHGVTDFGHGRCLSMFLGTTYVPHIAKHPLKQQIKPALGKHNHRRGSGTHPHVIGTNTNSAVFLRTLSRSKLGQERHRLVYSRAPFSSGTQENRNSRKRVPTSYSLRANMSPLPHV